MQKLAEICIKRPVFASMLILALVVVGAAAYYKLGVDRLPSVDLPTVYVRTTLPGAGPEEVETQVSEVIEEAVNTVEGIEELRSISGTGSSIVILTFNLSRDVDVAAQDVRDRVATVLRRLPDDTEPPTIAKADADSDPAITIAVSSDRSLRELTEFAETTVKEQLERSAGVGEVRVEGGVRRTVNVWIDADKLVAFQMPVTAVHDAIERQNADVPGGQVTGSGRELTLRTMGRLTTPEAFADIVIETRNGQPIRIRDVGRVEDGTAEQRSASRLNGKPTVILEVRRQSGANTVKVIEGIKAKLAEIQPQLPSDVKLEVLQDQSRYIYNALHEINVHLVLGSILACLVVLAFMRSWRSTIIAGIAIPTSVVATFGKMWLLDFTLNSVTMLALVLMVGIVIDDAIVVLENIFRFIEEKKMNSFEAARAATAEIGLAVLATTLSLVVIFIPVSFMSSVSGRFLFQFGITAAVAVMVSLLVSFTLTPMMSARLLRGEAKKHQKKAAAHAHNGAANGDGHDAGAASRGGFYGYIDRTYTRLLELAMRHRIAVSILAVLVILSSVPLYQAVRLEYTPGNVDEGEFQVQVTGPQSASWVATDKALKQIEQDIQDVPGVQYVLSSSGGGFLGGVSSARMYVRMVPHEERVWSISRMLQGFLKGDFKGSFEGNYSQSDVMMAIRQKVRKYKDVRVAVRAFSAFNTGGGRYEIDFVIKGPELKKLAEYTDLLRQQADKLGIVDADTTLKLDAPELRVNIDRQKAADLGIDANDIGTALRLMIGGETEVSRYRDPKAGEDYLVQLRLSEQDRNDPEILEQLYLPRRATGNGSAAAAAGSAGASRLIRLSNIASLLEEETAGRIDRTDRARSANLRAAVAPGYALGDRLEAIQQAADELRNPPVNMPPAYTTWIAGRGRELNTTFYEFLIAFGFSIALMYMILASQFESVLHPLTILLSLPLSIPFALLSLWATGGTLNLYSALGILVLFGVVKKNSILQIDHMNQLRERGMERHAAIIQANRDRLRPILMTTLALVAGMLPLALGTGPGAEERQAVAVVVIGGQSLSLLLTLLVTPVAYSLFDDIGAKMRSRRRRDEEDTETAPPAPIAEEAREPVAV